jgi:hypothetical protein
LAWLVAVCGASACTVQPTSTTTQTNGPASPGGGCMFDVPPGAVSVAASLPNDAPAVTIAYVMGSPSDAGPLGGQIAGGTYHLTSDTYYYDVSPPTSVDTLRETMVIDATAGTIEDVVEQSTGVSRLAARYLVQGTSLTERFAACDPGGQQVINILYYTADATTFTLYTGPIGPASNEVLVYTKQTGPQPSP